MNQLVRNILFNMKTNIKLFFFGLIGLMTSCTKHTCTIEGVVDNAKAGDTLIISRIAESNFLPTDTILLDKDGKFMLKESCDSVTIATYFYYGQEEDVIYSDLFFIEEGNIKIKVGLDGSTTGTLNNDLYQGLKESLYRISEQMDSVYRSIANTANDSDEPITPNEQDEARLAELDIEYNRTINNFVRTNIALPVGYYTFILCSNMFDSEEIIELCGQIDPAYRESRIVKYLLEEAENSSTISEGEILYLPPMTSIDGTTIDIMEIVAANRLTLIDCWASWCGPCMEEMPNVVALYETYHKKGLEIIGISFDEDAENWKAAIENFEAKWIHVSELKAWENIMTQEYGVTSIPFTILLGPDGSVITTRLRGDELEVIVKGILD